jgi:anti-sigma B factor antagonist
VANDDGALQTTVDDDGVVVIVGEVDIASAPTLDAVLQGLDASQPVEIDVSLVTFIDSSGLRALMTLLHRARENASMITLIDPQAAVLRVLEIAGIADLFLYRRPPTDPTASDGD